MPHLQREAEFLVQQAEKLAGLSDSEGQVVVPQKRRSRNGPVSPADNVILSSKFVVESIRDRYDGEDPEPFWLEFPRSDAESLEKRGIEVLADPTEQPPRKKIALVKIAEPVRFTKIEFPQKRNAKGKISAEYNLSSSPPDRGNFYHLTTKDTDWLDVYNNFCGQRKWPVLSPHNLEEMLTALDIKRNDIALAHVKSDISAANKTAEGSPKRHEKDYFLLQKFVAYTPNTFDQLDHLNLGRSFGLTTQTAFDIWEYWKLKVQDNFYQPLVFPPANIFDYRRISLLAAWNMTTVNYAQRLRHDAERIRLMYDLLQKRNHTTIKVMAREEELANGLVELSLLQSDAKVISPDLLELVIQYMHELSAQHQPDPTIPLCTTLEPLRDWLEASLGPPAKEAIPLVALPPPPIRPSILTDFSPVAQATIARPIIFAPFEIRPAPNIKEDVGEAKKPAGRPLRSHRAELPKNITFEHADNSCCENGPLDEDEVHLGKGSLMRVKEEEEPLYMINKLDDSSPPVLQEIFHPALEFRTRLRSYKKTG